MGRLPCFLRSGEMLWTRIPRRVARDVRSPGMIRPSRSGMRTDTAPGSKWAACVWRPCKPLEERPSGGPFPVVWGQTTARILAWDGRFRRLCAPPSWLELGTNARAVETLASSGTMQLSEAIRTGSAKYAMFHVEHHRRAGETPQLNASPKSNVPRGHCIP